MTVSADYGSISFHSLPDVLIGQREDMNRGADTNGKDERGKHHGRQFERHFQKGHQPHSCDQRQTNQHERQNHPAGTAKHQVEAGANDKQRQYHESESVLLHVILYRMQVDRRPRRGYLESLILMTVQHFIHRLHK